MGFNSRPLGLGDTNFRTIPDTWQDEAFQGEYTGNNLIYKGFARPGASTALPVWQIAKLTYDGSNNVTSILWPLVPTDPTNPSSAVTAACSNDYLFIWNSRHSYTYQ